MGKLFENKNTWEIGIDLDRWATTVGIVSQLIPRLSIVGDGKYAGQALVICPQLRSSVLPEAISGGILDTRD